MVNFKKIIADQKEELIKKFEREKIIEREILKNTKKLLDSKLVKVISGIRRCGKSIFACQLLKDKNYGYVNFDEEQLAGIRSEELNSLLETIYEVYGKVNYLLLDEIQNISKWELFVNRLQRQGFNIIVTGSNAKLLSRELATYLTGRHTAIELFPFSFREYLQYKEIKLKAETTEQTGIIKKNLSEYINIGGLPETLKEIDVRTYLKSLYSSIITKDILVRYKIRYIKTFRDLALYIMSNFSQEFSFNKLKKIFKLGSDHTTKNYIGYLEESYLIFSLEKFSFKKKESLVGNRKIYVIDTGLANVVSFRFSQDIGRLYENVVAIELKRKQALDTLTEIFYWKNHKQEEVDFVIKKSLKIKQLIQVCYNIEDYDVKKRELRALLHASKELKCKNLFVITDNYEAEETIENKKIKFLPLWKWLLNN